MAKQAREAEGLGHALPMVSARPVSESSVPSAMPQPKSRIVPQSILTASFQFRVKRRSDQFIGSTNNASGPRKSPIVRRLLSNLSSAGDSTSRCSSSVLYVPPGLMSSLKKPSLSSSPGLEV